MCKLKEAAQYLIYVGLKQGMDAMISDVEDLSHCGGVVDRNFDMFWSVFWDELHREV